jgi:hypothetical protein
MKETRHNIYNGLGKSTFGIFIPMNLLLAYLAQNVSNDIPGWPIFEDSTR